MLKKIKQEGERVAREKFGLVPSGNFGTLRCFVHYMPTFLCVTAYKPFPCTPSRGQLFSASRGCRWVSAYAGRYYQSARVGC